MTDAPDRERFDPTRLVGRVTVAVLALAGVVLVGMPSTRFGWAEYNGAWAATPTLVIANLTALLGVGIALAIAWSHNAHRAAPLLGVALGAAALAWGLQSADVVLGAGPDSALWLRVAQLNAWMFASAMFGAFCTRFPRVVTRADYLAMLQRATDGHLGSGLSAREDPFTALDAPMAAWDRWLERTGGGAYQRKLNDLGRRWGLAHAPGYEPAWVSRLRPWLYQWMFRDAWMVVLAAMPVVAAVTLFGRPKDAAVPFAVTAMLGIMSCFALRFTIINAAVEERRRVLWIAAGVVGAFVIFQFGFWAFLLSALFEQPRLGLGLFALTAPLAAFSLVVGLAIATFGGGALDPGLAIKRTLITGIVATLLTFMFAMVEAFVANVFAEHLGLPTAAAPAVASAAVAVALGPMWKKTSVWVGGKLGVEMPDRGHGA
jgi:hypothetical protein